MNEEKKINGLTFLEFMLEFKGKRIFNHYGKEVPIYILYWNKIKTNDVFLKYVVKNREY